MNYTYFITNENGQHYRSNRDYPSVNHRWVEHEVDATFMSETDLHHLLREGIFLGIFSDFCRIHVCLGRYHIGSICVNDFAETFTTIKEDE